MPLIVKRKRGPQMLGAHFAGLNGKMEALSLSETTLKQYKIIS